MVEPEILDSLDHNDPRALANRRDLRFLNTVMGNFRWFERVVYPQLRPDDQVLELGAGEGVIGLRLARARPDVRHYLALDFAPPPDEWPTHYEWRQVDCMAFEDFGERTLLCGSMILHQFHDEVLQQLGAKINASALRLLAFVEPARYPLHLWQLRLIGPMMCDVSRHDGAVSIRAGFRGDELPALLGLGTDWRWTIRQTWLGGYRFLAERKAAS